MRPALIQIGNFGLPAYGTMLVISFLAALVLVKRAAKRYGIAPAIIENLAFWIMVGVIIGGRLLYVMFHLGEFADFISIFEIWNGGMMFFGGFIGAFIAGLIYVRKENLPVLQLCDIVSPSIALGEFFTRIGCFLNGCCFGRESNLPWAVRFPNGSFADHAGLGDRGLHPTQLYSSLFGLMFFFFLQKMLGKRHYHGEIFCYYLIFSGIFRFGVDFIRYYENLPNFLINQGVSIAAIVGGVVLLAKIPKKKFEEHA